jgi:hypothetical protein
MTHFYLAMNHLVRGDFETALAEANRADAVGKEIDDPRLQTYAAFAVGWVEVTRGNDAAAVAAVGAAASRRLIASVAPMHQVLGSPLTVRGDHAQARTILEPLVAELEGFALPQWHTLTAALTAETYRSIHDRRRRNPRGAPLDAYDTRNTGHGVALLSVAARGARPRRRRSHHQTPRRHTDPSGLALCSRRDRLVREQEADRRIVRLRQREENGSSVAFQVFRRNGQSISV